jgi:hypothetical protein
MVTNCPLANCARRWVYSGRKITESFGNVTVRRWKDVKNKRGARLSTVCLSMYSITEKIYYSQLSSVAIPLQPETNCFTSYNAREWLCFLSPCAIVFRSPPASHVSSSNGQWSSQLFCVHYTGLCQTSNCVWLDMSAYADGDRHRVSNWEFYILLSKTEVS